MGEGNVSRIDGGAFPFSVMIWKMETYETSGRAGREKSFCFKARFRSVTDNLQSKFSVNVYGTKDFSPQTSQNPSADVFRGPFSRNLFSVPARPGVSYSGYCERSMMTKWRYWKLKM